ncbi:MAG: PKD domain-containing protein [Nocardioides sp.]
MTRHARSRRAAAASLSLLLLTPVGLLATSTAADAHSPVGAAVTATEPAAGATASGFLFYKFPLPLCDGVGLNVSDGPYFSRSDCGFSTFTVSGAGAASVVKVKLFAAGPGAEFATLDAAPDTDAPGEFRVNLEPGDTWPAGVVTMRVLVDGEAAGETTFGHNLLAVQLDEIAGPIEPGDTIPVTGTIVELENDGPTDTSDSGVPATFTLRTSRPDGTTAHSQPVTAAADGTFTATVPASATTGISAGPDQDFETVLSIEALDATYEDAGTPPLQPATGTWAAERAGATTATVVSPPTTLLIRNSFVSSVGWVKPGETYPSRLFVTNGTAQDFDDVTVTVPSPDGATFTQARTGAGSAGVSDGTVTWSVGSIPSADADGPTVVSLVLESKADTLVQDPTLVWKDLSSTATLRVDGTDVGESRSRGPRVIPQNESYDTARFGDRPFPVVPVDYFDRKHQDTNSGRELSEVINSEDNPGSTFNLFQEMSLEQLFPHGTVPSSDIATADFTYEGDFPFTQLEPAGTCHGATAPQAAGTPLYAERIADGFYQLPGTTDYYGDDKTGTAVAGSVAGVGALQDIDSACGPTGKLVVDAAAIADPEIDYSDYDTDKDGIVDFFMVVFAGCGGNGASQLGPAGCAYADAPYDNVWPHSSSLEFYYNDPETGLPGFTTDDQLKDLEGRPLFYTDDSYSKTTTTETPHKVFVRIGPYNVNPETAIDKASVISHEYGHSLGLPDFYSTGGRETYGDWNLMATDKSQNMDVFSRQEMGWIVPEVLKPGQTEVTGWTDSKEDTHTIHWTTEDGTPYTLSGPDVHNAEAYVAKLPGRQLIDPAKFDTGDKASQSHAWWSGSGNDFGCAPEGGHNLDVAIPGLEDLPAGSTVELEMKSLFDIEWDYDYGYVLTSTDGGETYTSHASTSDYATTTSTNPNTNGCQTKYGNGITGSSGSFAAGTQLTDAPLGNYPDSVFLADSFDISDLAGAENGVLRFSYATDPGLARPGWFIDDLVVTATTPSGDTVLLDTDLETSGGPDDARMFNGGCREDLTTAKKCTKGWRYIDSSSESPQDHAYYLEMRDRSGFDNDSNGQNDRDPIGFAPGLSLVYTDEAHGYGNAGTDDPPAQSPLDSTPEPGSDTPNLNDAAFTTATGRSGFTDSGEGHTDNYSDPAQSDVDERYAGVANPWRFQYDCLTFDVTRMSGQDVGPAVADGNLTGDVTFDLGSGCGTFDYGYVDETPGGDPANAAPEADAVATPNPARIDQTVTLDARGSTDSDTAAQDLDYSWDFGDGGTTKDADGSVATVKYAEAGTYTATVTVTDPQGATDTATAGIVVDEEGSGENTAPTANAKATPRKGLVGDTFTFDGSGSTDAESPNGLTYSWNFDNGGPTQDATGKRVSKSFGKAGVFDVTLTVTDPSGGVDAETVRVKVARKVACGNGRITRHGSWRAAELGSSARGGKYCDNLGKGKGKDKLTLTFTGPRLKVAFGKAKTGGKAKIVVDGVTVGTVSFRGPSKRPVFGDSAAFGGLGDGEHTAKLVMLKGAGYVDDLVIWGRLLR